MKANDLRIGNWVSHPSGERMIGGVLIDSVEFMPKDTLSKGDTFEFLDGIPLTEDWLKRFGWTDGNKNNFIGVFGLLSHDGKYYLSYLDDYCLRKFTSNEIKHVHQLQNLYFALTGTELTLVE